MESKPLSAFQAVLGIIVLVVIGALVYATTQRDNEQPGQTNEEQEVLQEQGSEAILPSPAAPTTPADGPAQNPASRPAQAGNFGLAIYEPVQSSVVYRGGHYFIKWTGRFSDRLDVRLRKTGTNMNLLLISGINANTGQYEWTVPTSLTLGQGYYIATTPLIYPNETPATSATFTVSDDPAVSKTESKVEATPYSLSAEENCFSNVSVIALNEHSLPISGKQVVLSSARPTDYIVGVQTKTSTQGLATFKVNSKTQGTSIYTATIDGVLIDDTATVSYFNPPPFCSTR